ncbi:MAG: hypothetical protein Q4F67_00125 [Propionibacteriaceae bacterium]|nr:hypothetical protein [Propionibacteriaceae bacterium]
MSDYLPATTSGSVLPVVRAESRPGGTALVLDAAAGRSMAISIGLGIVTAAVMAFWLASLDVIGFVIGVGAIISGIVVGVASDQGVKAYRRAHLSDAELLLPRVPLRLGDPMTIRYTQHRLRSRAEVRAITATVFCQEWVRYRVGTDTRTDTHELWQAELPVGPRDPIGDAALLNASWQMHLPPHLPPSFQASDNKINWFLRVRVDIPGRPDIRNEFRLPIIPEVLRDLR